jgi:hypothetical protein
VIPTGVIRNIIRSSLVVGRNHTRGRGIRFVADARSADIYLGTMTDQKEGQWEAKLSGCDCRIIDIFKNECNF